MLMGCIDQRDASVGGGGAGDAPECVLGRIGKASRRDAILAQGLENAVQPMSITRKGS